MAGEGAMKLNWAGLMRYEPYLANPDKAGASWTSSPLAWVADHVIHTYFNIARNSGALGMRPRAYRRG